MEKDKGLVNFDEDDDKFFQGLDGGDEANEERERRKAEKKSLKFMAEAQPVEFEPIRKNLYIESREISLLTDKEVAEFRKKNGDIKVRGV